VQEDPIKAKARALKRFGSMAIDYSKTYDVIPAKQEVKLTFALNDLETSEPLSGLQDVQVMWTVASRQVHERINAVESKEKGIYEVSVKLPDQGVYYLYVQCASRNFSFNNPQYHMLKAVTK
jgi:hypothetical protein